MNEQPIIYRWTGETFEPSTNYQAHLAGQRYEAGQTVPLIEWYQRSDKSHDHYFATLHDLWLSLPEHLDREFPNEEVFRAHGIIKTGYCIKRQLVLRSRAAAEEVAAFMRPSSPLAIITVEGSVVTEWTAESQAYRAMGKRRFQESKDAVLDWAAALVGVVLTDPERAREHAYAPEDRSPDGDCPAGRHRH